MYEFIWPLDLIIKKEIIDEFPTQGRDRKLSKTFCKGSKII